MTPITQAESAPAADRTKSTAGNKQAQDQQQAKLSEACQMFEAMFLNLLWKEMRRTVPKSGIMHGGMAEDMFTNMMDEAVSQASANEGSMGIAHMLERQLSQMPGVRPGGQLGQETKTLAKEGKTQAGAQPQGYFSRPLKPLSSKEADQTQADPLEDQTKAADAVSPVWQALPGNGNRRDVSFSRHF